MICNLCQKQFKSAQSLSQHRVAKHGIGAGSAKMSSKKKKKAPVFRPRGGSAASRPLTVPTVAKLGFQTTRFTGSERIHTFEIKAGESVLQLVDVTSGVTDRLSRMLSCFQKVQWHRVTLSVTSKFPTIVAGGYVLAPVPDPEDIEEELDLNFLSTQRGAKIVKWWENATVNLTCPQKKLYTSPGPSRRLYTPGFFVLRDDGLPNQAGSVTLTLSYDVSLSAPGLQGSDKPQVRFIAEPWCFSGKQYLADKSGEADLKHFMTGYQQLDHSIHHDYSVSPPITVPVYNSVHPNKQQLSCHKVRLAFSGGIWNAHPWDPRQAAFTPVTSEEELQVATVDTHLTPLA